MAVAQQPAELPSAPSATLQQQQQKDAAAQAAANPAPQQSSSPALPLPAIPKDAPSAPAPKPPTPQNDAKADTPSDDQAITKIVVGVNEVNVIFTVTDKRNRFVKDLSQPDFKFVDDGKPVASIRDFRKETNLPLRVGLLIDSSNSIRDRFKFEQESAIEFLNQIIRPKFDKAFVIGFDTTAEVTQDFTDDTDLLGKGVRMLRPGGGTAMYDAIYYACRDKLLKENGNTAMRKAMILLSDGEDNQSRVTREEAVEMAQRAEVIIYAISTNTSGLKLRGDKVLERFAEATGGRAFFPFKISDVANAFSEIQDELRSQYAVSYVPADFKKDGHYRAIEIAADNKKYKVRARKGYYAPKN
ncbi:von Willebrand factor, type A [Candidatus Koribacter versatilis Ellin345]|uniref:von Willebrand factor, type A n=1 Tax=Koribacter versatilis (strain Ellin345) TaxID=204669 RepID=Q1ILA5_KORVE|nr:von Willebrand factor, type A [Candidatus Koribacter versatilis Ellin345]